MRIKQLFTTLLLTIFLIFNTNTSNIYSQKCPDSLNYDFNGNSGGNHVYVYTLDSDHIIVDSILCNTNGNSNGNINKINCPDSLLNDTTLYMLINKGDSCLYYGSDNVSGLPIELISFDASRDGTFVDLSWVTGSETNNDYFELERSFDGLNWDLVTIVKGQGNTSERTEYSRTDRHHNLNDIVYYKLCQTDFDGKVEVFDIKSINMGKRKVLKILNTLGQEVDINYDGLKFVIYDDGETATLK